MITTIPTLCGSISTYPSSLISRMHNAAYKALDVPFTFVSFGVENVKSAVNAIRALGIRGMNVSKPYKVSVIKYLDVVDATAQRIGAVNTILNENSKLIGYNTDWIGAVRALQEKVSLSGTRSIVLGAGGAARAIVYGLISSGSDVIIYNRTSENAKLLVRDFGIKYGGKITDLSSNIPYDILINATSIGFHQPGQSPILPFVIRRGSIVMDVVFEPVITKLIEESQSIGCTTIKGVRMLLHQACEQVKIYTGKKIEVNVMENVVSD